MSVSLCALRFEIAEARPLPTSLNYPAAASVIVEMSAPSAATAPTDSDAKEEESSAAVAAAAVASTAAANGGGGGGCGGSAAAPYKNVMKRLRGRRRIHEIVIETHTADSASLPQESKAAQSMELASTKFDKMSEKKLGPRATGNQINFFSGNPFVEVTQGILHLFKENSRTSLTEDVPRSEMICILAVPAAMSTHDLLQFTAPCFDNISSVRIIRDSTPNQYMVLMKFREQASADEFYKAYNGKRFNSIETEVCHLVYIAKVETTKEFDAGCLPLEGYTELPTCPVCLERMDESVDGILTILCNHSFHGNCLDKWGDTSCPVCRYCQTPEVAADNRCSECHVQESLWICLICGHVGCSRYAERHAYKHFLDTQHTYAMQLGNNRVWDYAGDNYVHRLIQNKADGKLVEFNESAVAEQDEKLDSMQLEYTYLLTSQLESQRLYFEDKIDRIEQESQKRIEELNIVTKEMIEENSKLKQRLNSISRDKTNQEKRIQQLTNKLQKTCAELGEEKQINACLRQNQQEWLTRVNDLDEQLKKDKEEREKEVNDLKEQLRDIMFYIEAQQTLRNATEVSQREIEEGKIVVAGGEAGTGGGGGGGGSTASGSSSSRRKKHR